MKTAAVQMEVTYARKGENFNRAALLVSESAASGADTVLLPEMWDYGYFPGDLESAADEDGMETKAFLSSLSLRYGVNIVGGSVTTKKRGRFYNTCYVFNRTGHLEAEYDKTHLFSPLGEDRQYEKGEREGLFSLDGVMCGILLCYDLRFPELARTLALNGAQVIFTSVFWPQQRRTALLTLARCRAIENEVFVVLSSAVGKTSLIEGAGYSTIYGPSGEKLAVTDDGEAVIVASLDEKTLLAARKDIPVYSDRRPDLYR